MRESAVEYKHTANISLVFPCGHRAHTSPLPVIFSAHLQCVVVAKQARRVLAQGYHAGASQGGQIDDGVGAVAGLQLQ